MLFIKDQVNIKVLFIKSYSLLPRNKNETFAELQQEVLSSCMLYNPDRDGPFVVYVIQ